MEHISVTNLNNGYVRLTPEEGYRLFSERTQGTYRHAVTKEPNQFKAVEA